VTTGALPPRRPVRPTTVDRPLTEVERAAGSMLIRVSQSRSPRLVLELEE
jgi:hypothetical protein